MTIKELNPDLRPYEKCMQYGPQVLSDEELLAIIIRCGTQKEDSVSLARRVLSTGNQSDGLLNMISLSIKDLQRIKGIGPVKAMQLKCIVELSTRIATKTHSKNLVFSKASLIAEYYMEQMRHLKREHLRAMFLDTACHMLGEYEVSCGTVNSSLASPREVFIEALKQEAVNIILIHNHPSGNPSPSMEDIQMTMSMIKAGQFIGIRVIDHIIIGDNNYISLREKGIIKEEKS